MLVTFVLRKYWFLPDITGNIHYSCIFNSPSIDKSRNRENADNIYSLIFSKHDIVLMSIYIVSEIHLNTIILKRINLKSQTFYSKTC